MAIGVLARVVDFEADMGMVLHAAHVEAAGNELGDKLLDEGGLTGIVAADDGNCRRRHEGFLGHGFAFNAAYRFAEV